MVDNRIYISFDDISTYVKNGIDVYYESISLVKIKGLDGDTSDAKEAPAEQISNKEYFFIERQGNIQ